MTGPDGPPFEMRAIEPDPVPPLRERLRTLRITRSGCWHDAELLAIIAAERVEDAGMALHRLAGYCHRRAIAARDAACERERGR